MNVFPQLSTGAVGQFPFSGRAVFRTAVNELSDGSEVAYSDPDREERVWELNLSALTDTEWNQVEALFGQVGGRYGTFLFLEPGANLLLWSSDATDAVWLTSGGASVTTGLSDPIGGTDGFRVDGASGATLSQTVAVPGSLRYCASVWARSAGSGGAVRVTDGAGVSVEAQVSSDNLWRRYSASFPGASAETSLSYELENGAASVEAYGPQLEAQPAPSGYKATGTQSGVFANARFDSDELEDRVVGSGAHSGVVRIVWTPSLT